MDWKSILLVMRRAAWRCLPVLVLPLAFGACSDATGPGETTGPWAQVQAGDLFTCGLTTRGQAYCWGAAVFGQLGDSDVVAQVTPVAVRGGHTFRTIAVGSDHACGLDGDGLSWCWGLNDYHELGATSDFCNATFRFALCASTPIATGGGLVFDSIVVAGYATCGLAVGGAAWCWGWSDHGQLGSGSVGDVATAPRAVVGGRTFTSVSLDLFHACGIAADHSLYCWGSNIHGQLAADTIATPRCGVGIGFFCAPNPVSSAAGMQAAAITTGSTHTCAIALDGTIWCWGSNQYGVLGNPNALGGRVPVAVAGNHTFSTLSAGADHSCALEADGAAWCWGVNDYGQIGVAAVGEACPAFGSAQPCRTSPVAVESGLRFTALSAGTSHTCAVTARGAAYCWGRGTEGQLGDGRAASSAAPVRVLDPR